MVTAVSHEFGAFPIGRIRLKESAMKPIRLLAAGLLAAALTLNVTHAQDTKPLRALLVTGGCCHDYAKQKDILKSGIEARANIVVDQIHTPDSSTKPPLPIYGNPDF